MSSKRSRPDEWTDESPLVLNVGGQRFETTVSLLVSKSTYFKSKFADGAPQWEVFVDRDPDAFALLLRFLRLGVLGGLLPEANASLCSAVMAEAEFFGIDTFLEPIKATAYRNICLRWMTSTQMDEAIKYNDFSAAQAFDREVGSVSEALDKGILPARFFGPERRLVKSLVAPASTTWVHIGLTYNEEHEYVDSREAEGTVTYPFQPKPQMRQWQPVCVRRVCFFASVELDGRPQPEPEALLLLTDDDQEAWMRESSADGSLEPEGLLDVLSHGQRMLTVSDFINSPAFMAHRRDASTRDIWTKLVVADAPADERIISAGAEE